MKKTDLSLELMVAVASHPIAFGKPARDAQQARVVSFPTPKRPRGGGHPLNVEIEWTDPRLISREQRVDQYYNMLVRARDSGAAKTISSSKLHGKTDDELRAQANEEDRLSRYCGKREVVYSGCIVSTWEDWEARHQEAEATKAAYIDNLRKQDDEVRAKLAPVLEGLSSHLAHKLAPQHYMLTEDYGIHLTIMDVIALHAAWSGTEQS